MKEKLRFLSFKNYFIRPKTLVQKGSAGASRGGTKHLSGTKLYDINGVLLELKNEEANIIVTIYCNMKMHHTKPQMSDLNMWSNKKVFAESMNLKLS